ncbi:MAG TPA: sensor histidine kinase [Thermoanaerobaculia bacterium]|nr:sensor histidine kinase [Thermoanaerobaculia bacterium]
MKTLKILIRIEAVLLAVLGWLEAFANRNLGEAGANRAPQDDLALSFLGMGFLVFAVLLFLGSDLMLIGNRRRLGRWLAGGNVFLCLSAFVHGSGKPLDWILLLVPAGMAVALAWASAIPLKPEDAAAELAELRIPDEVRQALLRQVGESAAQEERNRLARDLHDSVKQQLFTINVGAATAQERWERDTEGAQTALLNVRRSAREAMVEMQAMLHQLRPQALTSSTGLVEALREQAEALGYRSGAQVTVELGPEIPDDRMPPGALEALFRIAQEALANVAHHARAGTVRVWIGQQREAAVLWVIDDGQGFDPGAAASGMGLRNLRERAVALRGALHVESAPGAGTRIAAEIPLNPSPVRPETGLEEAIRWERNELWNSVITAILFLRFRPFRAETWEEAQQLGILIVMVSFFLIGWSWSRTRKALAGSAGKEPAAVSLLRVLHYRNRALFLFTAVWWAPWSVLPAGEGGIFKWAPWILGGLVCAGWALRDFIKFHRFSEPRSWRTLRWSPSRRRSGFVPGALVIALLLTSMIDQNHQPFFPLKPGEVLFLVLGVVAALYVLLRQPQEKGAPA